MAQGQANVARSVQVVEGGTALWHQTKGDVGIEGSVRISVSQAAW